MKLFKVFALVNLLLSPLALAQGDKIGSGGEGFVPEFRFKTEQLKSWVIRNQFQGINTFGNDKKVLSDSVVKTADEIMARRIQVVPVTQELKYGEQVKTCINHPDQGFIECNTDRWAKETPESQYIIVIHEVLGYLGVEANRGIETSDYQISMQFYPYVGIQYVLNDRPMDAANLCYAEYQRQLKRLTDYKNMSPVGAAIGLAAIPTFVVGSTFLGPFVAIPLIIEGILILASDGLEYNFTNSSKMSHLLQQSQTETLVGTSSINEFSPHLNKITARITGMDPTSQTEDFLKARKQVAQVILKASNNKYLCKDGKLVKFRNVDEIVQTILSNQQ